MIYCFDIDGTICTLEPNSDYAHAAPYAHIIKKINKLYTDGHQILMMTARGSVSGVDWEQLTKKQLAEWEVKYHQLIMNQKPNADFYIDDKAINIKDWEPSERVIGVLAGAFDLLHPGYIHLFEDAKRVCNYLMVALHEDPSVENSNKHKPIHSVDERMTILGAVKFIDEVVSYKTEKDLENLLHNIKPQYRILGSDYTNKKITGEMIESVITHYHTRDHDWSYSKLRSKL
jgi:cytidyltransferase-like protein